jgi:uncharacterized lipoprotein YbaY
MKITRSRIPWLLFILLLFLSVTNSQKLGAADMSIVIGSVGYRERIMLPLDAVISIILEDVARIDVKAV